MTPQFRGHKISELPNIYISRHLNVENLPVVTGRALILLLTTGSYVMCLMLLCTLRGFGLLFDRVCHIWLSQHEIGHFHNFHILYDKQLINKVENH